MQTVYYNGVVYTGELPYKEAFVVENGRFTYVGNTQEALAYADSTTVDLQGHFVCPGFNDSHMHLLGFGKMLQEAVLARHTTSLQEVITYMKQFATEKASNSPWIIGRGWNQDFFTDVNRMPNRYDLDLISSEKPVCIVRACGHCLVVNSKALELLHITADPVQPDRGSIGQEKGELDGRLYDNAMDLIYDSIPVPDKESIKNMIRLSCKELNSYGITSCQSDDYCLYRNVPWQLVNEAYQELEKSGELTVRVYEQANFTTLADLQAFAAAGNNTGIGTEFFKIGPLKMLGDGALGARTAYLSIPYADDKTTKGLAVFSQETFDEMIGYANEVGMQVAVHAIGDACLDSVLDAYEKALAKHPKTDHRHGIVHCQITRADQLERMKRMNLHIYAQSIFLDYDIHIVEPRVGKELAKTSYRWKTLMDGGLSVSNGSDAPVEFPDVMAGIQCAVTRSPLKDVVKIYHADEKFTVQEAIDSFTCKGAEASFEEQKKGRIIPGQLADFVVLDKNPFTVEAHEIKDILISNTYLGGKKVYGK